MPLVEPGQFLQQIIQCHDVHGIPLFGQSDGVQQGHFAPPGSPFFGSSAAGMSSHAPANAATVGEVKPATAAQEYAAIQNQEDAPPCPTCGSIMIRNGACYKCANCGTTSGCA